eukprot:6306020-Prymnesium_polylepis.1
MRSCDNTSRGALGGVHGSDRAVTFSARTCAATPCINVRYPGDTHADFVRFMDEPYCRKGAQVLALGQSLTAANLCVPWEILKPLRSCEPRETLGGRSPPAVGTS